MIILPIFTSSHSNNHYPSSSVEYKETRVISKYRDEMRFYDNYDEKGHSIYGVT